MYIIVMIFGNDKYPVTTSWSSCLVCDSKLDISRSIMNDHLLHTRNDAEIFRNMASQRDLERSGVWGGEILICSEGSCGSGRCMTCIVNSDGKASAVWATASTAMEEILPPGS